MKVLSALFAMAGAGTGDTDTRGLRRRPQREFHLPAGIPPPPAPPQQQPTISPQWRIPIGLAWAILLFALSIGSGLLWQAWEIRQSIRSLQFGVWTISDQEEFERRAATGGLILPNTRLIVRERLPGPHQP